MMDLEQEVSQLATQLQVLNGYLAARIPHKITRAPHLAVTAEMSAATIASSATAVTTLIATVPEGPDFEIHAITGYGATSAADAALPAAQTVNNDWRLQIIDSHRQIYWFQVAANVTTGASGKVWARNIIPTVTDPYYLPVPYRVPGRTIITVEVENLSGSNFRALQILFHGYRVSA